MQVTAIEKEFSITLSTSTFHPGGYQFTARNAGSATHNLVINGPGVNNYGTTDIPPGGSAMLSVTLQAGTYELYCGVDSHKELGMDVHITVM